MKCPNCQRITLPAGHPVCLACGTRMDEPLEEAKQKFREPMFVQPDPQTAKPEPEPEPEPKKLFTSTVYSKPLKAVKTK